MEHCYTPSGRPRQNRQRQDVHEGVEDQKEKKEWVLLHILRGSPGIKDRTLPALPGDVTCTANVMNTPASIICRVVCIYRKGPTAYKKDQETIEKIAINSYQSFRSRPSRRFFPHARNGKTNRKR